MPVMDAPTAALRSANIVSADRWARSPGVIYALCAGPGSMGGNTYDDILADFGWTTTNLTDSSSLVGGSGAEVPNASFKTLNFGTPNSILTDGSGDLLQSPSIFADPMGFDMAKRLLGSNKPPLSFVADIWGCMTVDSATETRSGFGLVQAGGTAGTTANMQAWIYSDGTNLRLESSAGSYATVGPAIAEQILCHRLRITRSDAAQTSWVIHWSTSVDGITFTEVGTGMAQVALKAPLSFGMYAFTTNRPALYGTSWFYYI